MSGLNDWALLVGIVTGALALAGAFWKFVGPKFRKADWAFDVILGAPAKVDPLSGDVVAQATPDIGTRVTRVEREVRDISESLALQNADRAIEAAEKAAAVAAKAHEVSEANRVQIQEVAESVEQLRAQVDEWQNVDRVQAEGMRAVATELGMPVGELPHPSEDQPASQTPH